jgi:alkylhydroperoxidase family enzyme
VFEGRAFAGVRTRQECVRHVVTRRFFVAIAFCSCCLGGTAEERAVAYLAREVPRWHRENQCFSCHNNGDGARALYVARQRHYSVPKEALRDSTGWLMDPGKWDSNRGNPAFSDKKLARIQFAVALAQAVESGAIRDRRALIQAADSLVREQDADGSWLVDTSAAVGSPVTYGPTLATYMARRTLEVAGAVRFREAIAKANGWFRANPPRSILDAAGLLLALPETASERLSQILASQNNDGGWGPVRFGPSEPFDTAVVLLALTGITDTDQTRGARDRGRRFLISSQQSSGGWLETTRPAGAQSYAQHVSTSAWAALALLATDPKR